MNRFDAVLLGSRRQIVLDNVAFRKSRMETINRLHKIAERHLWQGLIEDHEFRLWDKGRFA